MRLVSFSPDGGRPRVGGLLEDGRVVDLNSAYRAQLRQGDAPGNYAARADAHLPADMRGLFQGGDASLAIAAGAAEYAAAKPDVLGPDGERLTYPPGKYRLQAPIRPKKFFHTAGNFEEHHKEAEGAGFSHPVLPWIVFFQNVDAIVGHDEPVVYPTQLTRELDYELELAVVLKKSGKNLTVQEAESFIGGYVIFNDITARDIQRDEMKSGVFSFCKGIDTFCPLGPWIVTADDVPDPHNLAMELRVNGEVRQRSNTRNMSVSIPEIVAHYSPMGYTAGDVLSTGTVSGVAAFSADPGAWYLKPGDVVECEVERIGVLRNPIVSDNAGPEV